MANKKDEKKWIKKAIKNPGSLRKTAKNNEAIAKDGDIKKSFIEKAVKGKYGPKTEKRAELAKTLSNMRKKNK